jgi:predicted membrane protein
MKIKGQLTFAWILIGFGALLLAGNIFRINFGDIIWPLVIITIGLVLIVRPQTISPAHTKYLFAGDVRVNKKWDLSKTEVRMFAGDIRIDLGELELPSGETSFTVTAFAGDVKLYAPQDVGVAITTMAFVTNSRIDGEKMEHIFSGMDFATEGYDQAKKKFKLIMQCFAAEVRLESA